MSKERNLDDALNSMNELIDMQQQALQTADELIKLKDARLEIADQLINIYKKESKTLKVGFILLVVLDLVSLLILLT